MCKIQLKFLFSDFESEQTNSVKPLSLCLIARIKCNLAPTFQYLRTLSQRIKMYRHITRESVELYPIKVNLIIIIKLCLVTNIRLSVAIICHLSESIPIVHEFQQSIVYLYNTVGKCIGTSIVLYYFYHVQVKINVYIRFFSIVTVAEPTE